MQGRAGLRIRQAQFTACFGGTSHNAWGMRRAWPKELFQRATEKAELGGLKWIQVGTVASKLFK